MRRIVNLFAGLAGALFSMAALADCIDGIRKTTPGETQYLKRVSAALTEALPWAPQNWTLAPPREQGVGGLCKGDREGDFEITVTANYSYLPPKEEAGRLHADYRKLQSEIDSLRQMPPAITRERQEWLDKAREARRASNGAGREGNKELAQQKNAEAQDYSRRGAEVRDRYLAGMKPRLDQLEARQMELEYRRSEIVVSLVANGRTPQLPGPAAAAAIIVGKMPTPDSPGLKVHNVQAFIEGPAQKRAVIQDAIDKDALARIVQ